MIPWRQASTRTRRLPNTSTPTLSACRRPRRSSMSNVNPKAWAREIASLSPRMEGFRDLFRHRAVLDGSAFDPDARCHVPRSWPSHPFDNNFMEHGVRYQDSIKEVFQNVQSPDSAEGYKRSTIGYDHRAFSPLTGRVSSSLSSSGDRLIADTRCAAIKSRSAHLSRSSKSAASASERRSRRRSSMTSASLMRNGVSDSFQPRVASKLSGNVTAKLLSTINRLYHPAGACYNDCTRHETCINLTD